MTEQSADQVAQRIRDQLARARELAAAGTAAAILNAATLADEVLVAAFSLPPADRAAPAEEALIIREQAAAISPSPGTEWRLAWMLNGVARCYQVAPGAPESDPARRRRLELTRRAVALYLTFCAHGRGIPALTLAQDGLQLHPFLPPTEAIEFTGAAVAAMRKEYARRGGRHADPPASAGYTHWLGWALHNLCLCWVRRVAELTAADPPDPAAIAAAQTEADEAARQSLALYLDAARRGDGGDELTLPWLHRFRHHFRAALAPGWVARLTDGTPAEQLVVDVLARLPVADDLLLRRMREIDGSPESHQRPPGSPGMTVSIGGVPPDALGRWRVPSNVLTDLAAVPRASGPASIDRDLVAGRMVGDLSAFREVLTRTIAQLEDARAALADRLPPADYLARWPADADWGTLSSSQPADDPSGPIANSLAGDAWWATLPPPEIYHFDPDGAPDAHADGDPVSQALRYPHLVAQYCTDQLGGFADADRQAARRLGIQGLDAAVTQLVGHLRVLGGLSAEQLAATFVEALDPWSHRLDAWITGLADRRLTELRAGGPTGIRLGGYGWVEDLAPDPATPTPGEEPIFWHGPSVHHAATAAVLRSGDDATGDNPTFEIDLRSSRAEAARRMLEGIRAGADLAALLGYRFERELHDRGLDVFIAGVRAAYPAAVPAATTDEGRARIGVTGVVVDGLELLRGGPRKLSVVATTYAASLVPPLPSPAPVLVHLLELLDDVLDAVGDLVVAESVHGIMGGQPARAGTAADLLGRGGAVPDAWRVLQTPHRGRTVTNRLLAVCPNTPAPGWTPDALSLLEPGLDAWIAQRLGPAPALGVEISSAADPDAAPVTVTADRLLVGALRHVLDLGTPGTPLLTATLAELLGRASADLVLGGASWEHWRTLGRRLFDLVTPAAALLPTDGVLAPEHAAELAARVRAFCATVTATDPAHLAALGVPGEAAEAVVRTEALAELAASGTGDAGWVQTMTDQLQTLLGARVPLLPRVLPEAGWAHAEADAADLASWLDGWASVRPAARLRSQLGSPVAHAYQRPARAGDAWVGGRFTPASRPIAQDHLVADAALPDGAFAALVVDSWSDVLPGGDALTETGTAADGGRPTELTSVAFRADRPDAKAPNAILLAVPPDLDAPWTADQLALIVDDALELGKLRAVDLGDLPMLDDVLPLVRMDTFGAWGYLERDLLNRDALEGAPLLSSDPIRLEPLPRSNEIATGLAARVHDAAWFLSRQWQLGEFAGQDAATPVDVTLAGEAEPVHAWRPGAAGPWQPYDPLAGPLDAAIEAEPGIPGAPDAFDPSRGRHGFQVAVGSTVLTGADYDGGGLGWTSVRGDVEVSEPTPPAAPPPLPVRGEAIPAPVRQGGLPADRFWEFEDALVDLGATRVDAVDTGRMMLVGFAMVYGNDWYTAPLEVPLGALTRLTDVRVTDTFGRTTRLRPGGGDDRFSLYRTDGVDGLLLLPTGASWSGPPLEEVAILRDEMANLVWGIERTVTDANGDQIDRRAAWAGRPQPARSGTPDSPEYLLETTVPDHWSPLVAEEVSPGQVRFRLVPFDAPGHAGPMGRLLRPGFWMHEEEVPRDGLVLTRRPVLARWHDGSWHRWVRRTRAGSSGESDSGLTYDSLSPSPTWE